MIFHTLSLNQCAAMLGTTAETISDCIHSRGLPAAKIGRAFVLVEDDVIAWVRTQYGNFNKASREADATRTSIGKPRLQSPARSPAALLEAALAPSPRPPGRRRP